MLDIQVLSPRKTASVFEFRCVVKPMEPAPGSRSSRSVSPVDDERTIRFGYRATNFRIRHHEVWDAFYPLYYLTRNGGPLFGKGHDRARIRFDYPISAIVRDFFIGRSADLGIAIDVEAKASRARLDQRTRGDVLSFGGGKDSRLVFGMLRERGIEPTVVISRDPRFSPPHGDALVTKPIHGAQADRLMPGLMRLGRRYYVGANLGEAHLVTPWHRAYDYASVRGRRQMSKLFADLGVEMELLTPLVVVPNNIIQRILHDRYPDLYAGQISTPPHARREKNLRVALLKLYRDLPMDGRISDELFAELLVDFVRRNLETPEDFGYRDASKWLIFETRALICRLRDHPALAPVRDQVPPEWDAAWIDYIHTYVDPSVDDVFLAIYREYAQTVDEAPAPVERILV